MLQDFTCSIHCQHFAKFLPMSNLTWVKTVPFFVTWISLQNHSQKLVIDKMKPYGSSSNLKQIENRTCKQQRTLYLERTVGRRSSAVSSKEQRILISKQIEQQANSYPSDLLRHRQKDPSVSSSASMGDSPAASEPYGRADCREIENQTSQ